MIVSDRPPFSSLLRIFVVVVIAGWMILGQYLGVLAASLVYGADFFSGMTDPSRYAEFKNGILLAQGVGASIGLILIPWFYVRFLEQKDPRGFFKADYKWITTVSLLCIGIISFSISISPIVEWNANLKFSGFLNEFGNWARTMEDMAAALVKALTDNLTPLGFIASFVVVAIIPGIGEELVFRGLIQTEFQRALKNPHLAIWISAALFSAIHLQFLGFFPRMMLGAFLGYLYYWSGNLAVPMIGHFLNNGLQLTGLYLNQKGLMDIDMESPEMAPIPAVIAATIITLAILYYLRKYFTQRSVLSGDIN